MLCLWGSGVGDAGVWALARALGERRARGGKRVDDVDVGGPSGGVSGGVEGCGGAAAGLEPC